MCTPKDHTAAAPDPDAHSQKEHLWRGKWSQVEQAAPEEVFLGSGKGWGDRSPKVPIRLRFYAWESKSALRVESSPGSSQSENWLERYPSMKGTECSWRPRKAQSPSCLLSPWPVSPTLLTGHLSQLGASSLAPGNLHLFPSDQVWPGVWHTAQARRKYPNSSGFQTLLM